MRTARKEHYEDLSASVQSASLELTKSAIVLPPAPHAWMLNGSHSNRKRRPDMYRLPECNSYPNERQTPELLMGFANLIT